MWIWRGQQEKWLLSAAIIAFICLCLIKAQLPLLSYLDGTAIEPILHSAALADLLDGLLMSLISAYIFYVVINLWPRVRREREMLRVLNLLIAAIVDAYEQSKIYGHETPIAKIDLAILNADRLAQHAADIKNPDIDFLCLKYAMETAHSRFNDFQHSLGIAADLSAEHALAWLGVTDKVRLLADVYGTQPENLLGEVLDTATSSQDVADDPDVINQKYFKSTMQFRVMEFMAEARSWVLQTKSP